MPKYSELMSDTGFASPERVKAYTLAAQTPNRSVFFDFDGDKYEVRYKPSKKTHSDPILGDMIVAGMWSEHCLDDEGKKKLSSIKHVTDDRA